jgi:hypothetical protein
MRNLMVRLWNDDGGALIAAEWVFVATILVLGAITGLVAVRQAVLAELHDVANAIIALNQTYSFSGQSNCESSTAGSQHLDFNDSIIVRSTAALPWGVDNRACD